MLKANSHWNHPLRLASSVLVLAAAVTVVGACSSGEVTADDQIASAQQGLKWAGGCACLPIAACPALTGGCVRAPVASDLCGAATALCRAAGSSWCFVVADTKTCTNSDLGKTGTCDGGYCGTCPGCYTSTGLCYPGTGLNYCGTGAGACTDCNDDNECTKETCAAGSCLSSSLSNGTACAGGVCYGGKCCTGCSNSNGCQAGTADGACGTAGDTCAVCEKSTNPCVRSYCGAKGCVQEIVPVGTACSDGNVCNGEEACDANGSCAPGTAKDCASSDPCFSGTCDPAQGCVLTVRAGAGCNDGNACTIGDKCDAAGACVAGPLKPCNDGKVCTSDQCDPATGNCLNPALPDNDPCDDGATCTTGETCQTGVCKPAGTVACDDGRFCTKDTVVCPSGTCLSDPASMNGQICVPTDKCFYNGTCTAGACNGGTAVNCDDGNPCTKDGCNPATGCTHENEPATTACVDGNPCTADDHCRPLTGKCAGTPIVCAALDDCHAPGACDSATGRCDDPRRVDGFPCSNNTGRCASGVCQLSANGGAAGAAGVSGAAGQIASAGSAGVVGTLGGNGGATGTIGAGGGPGIGGNIGNGGSNTADGDVYQRNPGGCSCNVPNRHAQRGLALLGLLGLALGLARKPRR